MRKCERCGKELNKQQVWNHRKYCSRQCFAESYYGEKIEWNGVQIRPGKALEVLKLCFAGMTPKAACQAVGAHESVVRRLMELPGAMEILSKRSCPICGGSLPMPLHRKYCSDKCNRRAKYVRQIAAEGREGRQVDERRDIVIDLYRRGFKPAIIVQNVGVTKNQVKRWIFRSGVRKADRMPSSVITLRPLRHRLDAAKTADEWTEILRNSASATEKSDTVILVCARLHGSGAPGRYIGIATEQFWHESFYDGVCVAFCNILKNAITTIEWRGENFHLTRTFKTSGTFVWPDEQLGKSIQVTRAEFEHLISLKKTRRNAVNACVYADFVI